MTNFSINGFGRIGRCAARAWLKSQTPKLDLKAINTSGSLPASGWAYLLKHDTAYGILEAEVEVEDIKDPQTATDTDPLIGYLHLRTDSNKYQIPVLAQRNPAKIPWHNFQVDIVIESTGVFCTAPLARQHLLGGAKQVVLSAPAKDDSVSTAVIGVNEDEIVTKDRLNSISVISNASCTTNCVAPVAAVIHAKIGIQKATLLTVHGYTDDQNLQDNSHKDLRRARAAAANIVPTSTGAAQATAKTIPDLQGVFDGLALRVPVITGSISDFTFLARRPTSTEEINEIFIEASHQSLYQGILAVTHEPLVSSDIIGRPESAIVDLEMTRVIDNDLVKVLAWYDNEYGYSNRLVEQVIKLGENLS